MSDLEQQINEIKSGTILSSFDDKITLLQWLKKLEQAIKESNIAFVKNIEIIEKGNNTYALAITFEGGDTLTSNDFTVESINNYDLSCYAYANNDYAGEIWINFNTTKDFNFEIDSTLNLESIKDIPLIVSGDISDKCCLSNGRVSFNNNRYNLQCSTIRLNNSELVYGTTTFNNYRYTIKYIKKVKL